MLATQAHFSPIEVKTFSINWRSTYKPEAMSFSKVGLTTSSKPSFLALTIKQREPIKGKFKRVAHLRACKSSRITPYSEFSMAKVIASLSPSPRFQLAIKGLISTFWRSICAFSDNGCNNASISDFCETSCTTPSGINQLDAKGLIVVKSSEA